MPQISKHIPIKGYRGYPATIDELDYKTFIGDVYFSSNLNSVANLGNVRWYWNISNSIPFAFKIAWSFFGPVGADVDVYLTEMTSASGTTPQINGFRNMNRLFDDSSVLACGTYTSENGGSPITLNQLAPSVILETNWWVADPSKTYGYVASNNLSLGAIKVTHILYVMCGVNQ